MIMKVVTIHTKVSIRATCCSPGWTMILYTHRRCLEVAHNGRSNVLVECPLLREQQTYWACIRIEMSPSLLSLSLRIIRF
jgi:hypothetical protein